jgi:scyllo-inositol 2-dehydrogenase (NADP+)
MTDGRLAVAVVGAGWVSCNRHLPALAAHEGVRLTGMVAPAESLAALDRSAVARFGITRTASSFDSAVVADADAVMIGTPPATHAEVALQALAAGKHVLIEKPLALSTADADALIAAAHRAGKILAVVHNLNFCHATTKARQLVESGKLGTLRAVLGLQSSNHLRRLPVWYRQLPLGLFTDESPHLIYLLQSFLPDAQLQHVNVGAAVAADDNTPDIVNLGFRSAQGVPGTLQMSFVGSVSEWALILQGDRGTAAVDLFRDVLVRLPNDSSHQGAQVLRTSASAIGTHVGGIVSSGVRRAFHRLDYGNAEVVRRFVDAVTTGTPPSGIAATDGRAVVAVIDAAHCARRSAE